jgi:hypothetical protein
VTTEQLETCISQSRPTQPVDHDKRVARGGIQNYKMSLKPFPDKAEEILKTCEQFICQYIYRIINYVLKKFPTNSDTVAYVMN